jgi:hypothetical protein
MANSEKNSTSNNDVNATPAPAPATFSGGICAIIKEITRQAKGKITPGEIADKLRKAGLPVVMGTIARQSQEVKNELGITAGGRKNFTIEL